MRLQAPQGLYTRQHSVALDDASTVMPSEILGGKQDVRQLQIEEVMGAVGSKFYWRQI